MTTQNIFLELKRIENAKSKIIETMRKKRLTVPDSAKIDDLPPILETMSESGYANTIESAAKVSDSIVKENAVKDEKIFNYFDSMDGILALIDDDEMWEKAINEDAVRNAMLENPVVLSAILLSKREPQVAELATTDSKWIGAYTKDRRLIEILVTNIATFAKIIENSKTLEEILSSEIAKKVVFSNDAALEIIGRSAVACNDIILNEEILPQILSDKQLLYKMAQYPYFSESIIYSEEAIKIIFSNDEIMKAAITNVPIFNALVSDQGIVEKNTL